MISSDFKQHVTNILKNDYEIDCHRFSPLPDYGKSRESIIHCSQNGEKFTLIMQLTVDKGDHDGCVGSFNIILPEVYANKIESINKKINLDLINNSVLEVCTEMSQYLDVYLLSFIHLQVELINGFYIKNGEKFDLKKIESRIESDSYINFCTPFEFGKVCSDVKIIGNKIILTPERHFKDAPIFKEHSTLSDEGMDIFKANLIKSVIIYRKSDDSYDDRYKLDVDFYLPLTYEELKKQFLVNAMAHI